MDTYRCWAEIDRNSLRYNANVVRERVGLDVQILAVVKANGYGHGMVEVAQALADRVQLFGVANLEEAITLRRSLDHPILVLGSALPDERQALAEHGFIASISTLEEAEQFNRFAARRPALVNLVVDTGMGRMGICEKNAVELFKKVSGLSNVKIHSVSTHLPMSTEDVDYTRDELRRFDHLVKKFRKEKSLDYKVHVLPSAGLLAFSDSTFDIVRAGLILYGISPLAEFRQLLRPVMTWKTRIALIREMSPGSSISYGRTFITPRKMKVATLSAGYADGYPLHLSNRDAAVLVHGRRCALLGRITMDLMMIDVSEIDQVKVGDEVVLLGRQGDEEISATEMAERAGTIPWEIVTRIGSRVRRVQV